MKCSCLNGFLASIFNQIKFYLTKDGNQFIVMSAIENLQSFPKSFIYILGNFPIFPVFIKGFLQLFLSCFHQGFSNLFQPSLKDLSNRFWCPITVRKIPPEVSIEKKKNLGRVANISPIYLIGLDINFDGSQ